MIFLSITRKMVPIAGRASSFFEKKIYVGFNRMEEEGETEQQQTYQFIQGYKKFFTDYKYTT